MNALPTPHHGNKRPAVLRPDVRGAAATAPPRRVQTQPRQALPTGSGAGRLGRSLKAALLLGVAAGSAFGVVKMANLVEGSDALPLRSVVVVGGVSAVREAEVRAYAELSEGVPFFGIDTDAVTERVERHPYIRSAVVRRLPPDGLEIAVQERSARAVLSTPQGLYLVDDDGEVMKRARPGDDGGDVPLLTGFTSASSMVVEPAKLTGALALLRALAKAELLERASEIIALPATGFELVLADGARVRVGDNDFDSKLARLVATEQRLAAGGRRFSFMWLDDARHPERVAVRLRSTTETSSTGG